jgi:hypothetical protein
MLTIYRGELAPTLTYARRELVWVTLGTGCVTLTRTLPSGEVVEETIPALGKLTIKQQKARSGAGRAIEVDTYAVQQLDPEHPGTRLYALLNLTDPEQGEPYLVTVGGVNLCRCQAGRCRLPGCKHRDALLHLENAGYLDTTPAAFAGLAGLPGADCPF